MERSVRWFDDIEKQKKQACLEKHSSQSRYIFYKLLSVHDVYDDYLVPLVNKSTKVLDAGCGKKGIMNKYKGSAAIIVGMDLQLSALKLNSAMDYKVVSGVYQIPFKENSFDVIVSQWVVEHLNEPDTAFREFSRVLKKGGSLIVVTNSVYNPLMFFNAIMPEAIRDRIKKRCLPPEIEEDTFPTYYRCNTLGKMKAAMRSAGLSKKHACYVGDPSFFVYSKTIFPLTLIYELFTSWKFLRPFKMHVVAHYVKDGKDSCESKNGAC